MLALLAYLITVALIIFASLSVAILCSVKLYQSPAMHKGATLSSGLSRRKQIILAICCTNVARCFFSCVEFILFATNVVKEGKHVDSISCYTGLDDMLSRVMLVSRVFPTLLFFGYNFLIGDYFATVLFAIRELEYGTFRVCFTAVNVVMVGGVLICLLVFSQPFILNELCLVEDIILALWITRHAYGVNQFYVRNEDVVLDVSLPQVNQSKLLARMCRVVVVALLALFVYALMCCADLGHLLPNR